MQIVIPMSGTGQRFVAAGYALPKPLILVDGRPIIAHVVEMFPGETDFVFICNQTHLDTTPMRDVLTRLVPTAKIVAIQPHKLGPVHAVLEASQFIRDDGEVIVNYCDFGKWWDYPDFLNTVRARNADGAISAYRGFHPHMLGSTHYAFMRESDNWMLEIREKAPFTDNRMAEFASDGTYYFKTGAMIKRYFKELMDQHIDLNGEYYVSLVYNRLAAAGLKTTIYEIPHMLQWGTPADLEIYQKWSDYFTAARCPATIPAFPDAITVIPMAGKGERFSKAGFTTPKPLIPVDGSPMAVQAVRALPKTGDYRFVCQNAHLETDGISEALSIFPNAKMVPLDYVTEGQAVSCALGLNEADYHRPLWIGACDNGMRYDGARLSELVNDPSIDGVVFTMKGHASAASHPHMYGWVAVDAHGIATEVRVKTPVSDHPERDHAIVGAFYFRRADMLLNGLEALRAANDRINGEFYVDSVMAHWVKVGARIAAFEVDFYLGWGTPDDWRTYEYWSRYFGRVRPPLQLSVVVPCYNESAGIPALIDRLKTVALARPEIQFVLVNNGSTDNSAAIMDAHSAHFPGICRVDVSVNQGYGFGILSGLAATSTPYLGWTHADMQTDPMDIVTGWQLLSDAPNSERRFVKGNRKGRRWMDQFFTIGMAVYETVILGRFLWDINAQPNLFHRSFYETWRTPPHDFSLDLYVYYWAHRHGLKTVRFPVRFPPRQFGHSHWNFGFGSKVKFIRRTLAFSRTLKQSLGDL